MIFKGAGDFRQSVILQQPTRTPDQYGVMSAISWQDVANVKAAIRGLTAREQIFASQATLETSHIVNIRYRSDIDSTWRIAWGAVILNINSLLDVDNRRREIEMTCISEQPAPYG